MSETDLEDNDRQYHLRLYCSLGVLSLVFLLSGYLATFNVDPIQRPFFIYKGQIVSPVERLDLQTLPQDSHQGSYRKVVPFKIKPEEALIPNGVEFIWRRILLRKRKEFLYQTLMRL